MLENELHITDGKAIREIKDAVAAKHYHVACTKVFEITHPAVGSLPESINHPNHYFEMSYGMVEAKASDSS